MGPDLLTPPPPLDPRIKNSVSYDPSIPSITLPTEPLRSSNNIRDFPTFLSQAQGLGQGPVKFGGKKHLDHLNWENLMQSKRTGLSF